MATVTDVEVANASFPTVRQDLNDILEAIATNFSADAEPTTTYANQWWYETDTNKLYIRNEDNDAWIHVLTLDQTTDVVSSVEGVSSDKIEEGNSSVEVVDTGTGYIQINVDGAEVGRFASGGLTGFGETSPSATVHIARSGLSSGQSVLKVIGDKDSSARTMLDIENGADINFTYHGHVFKENGNVGIGTSSPLDKLDVVSTGNNFSRIRSTSGGNAATLYFQNSDTGTTSNDGTYIGITGAEEAIIWNTENTAMRFGTNNSERMRINSSGNAMLNTTSVYGAAKFTVAADTTSANPMSVVNTRTSAGTDYSVLFYRHTSIVGSIQTSLSATSYVTTSDYRLKENVVDMTDAIDRVKALPVKRFNFIADPDKTVDGFLAHEAQEIVPEAVTGEKDAMRTEEYVVEPALGEIYVPATDAVLDEDGNVVTEAQDEQIVSSNVEKPETLEEGQQWRETTPAVMGEREVPDYQGIDQSKLVPLLTGALKEAIAKIEALEARVTALES